MNEFEILKNRLENLHPVDGITEQELLKIEETLEVKLPHDYCEIAKFYGGGQIGIVSMYSFKIEDNDNVVEKTQQLRTCVNLPYEFIALAEPDESIIVMNTKKEPRILWIDATDVENIATGKFESKPDVWKTFEEFFAELLEQEEMDNL